MSDRAIGSAVLSFVSRTVWAMEEVSYRRMVEILARHASGDRLDEAALEKVRALQAARASSSRPREKPFAFQDGVAILAVHGVIAPHAADVNDISSPAGTSIEGLRSDLNAALADDDVRAILLDVDSPGGAVDGVEAFAEELHDARRVKPIAAFTDGQMCSAAYWLAAQAGKVYATRTATVGSIGVIAAYDDWHRLLEGKGIDRFVVTSVPGKAMTNDRAAVGNAGVAPKLQALVSGMHETFVDAVARGRGLPREHAAALGDGHVHVGSVARERGLVDGVQSFKQVLAQLQRSGVRAAARSGAAASADAGTEGENLPQQEVVMSNPTNAPAQGETITPALLRERYPAQVAALLQEAQQTERARIAGIQRLAKGVDAAVVQAAIDGGEAVGDAAVKFKLHSDAKLEAAQSARLQLVRESSPQPAGQDDAEQRAEDKAGKNPTVFREGSQRGAGESAIEAMPDGEEKWKAQFAANAQLQAEFGEEEDYLAFQRNKGRAKIYGGTRREVI